MAKKTITIDDKLKMAMDAINSDKEYKDRNDPVVQALSNADVDVDKISTGSIMADRVMHGGIPCGRVTEIYGPEASGKTTLALSAVAEVQRNGGLAAYIDSEHALDPEWAQKQGVDMDHLVFAQEECAESALGLVIKLANLNLFDIIVLDSVASLVPRQEMEGELGKQTVGLMARIMSSCLKQVTPAAYANNVAVVLINQTRMKVGVVFGSPETTPGGKALAFYESAKIRIGRKGKIEEGGKWVGSTTHVKANKLKTGAPFSEADTIILEKSGISKEAEVLNDAVALKFIKDSSKSYSDATTGEKLTRGFTKMVAMLEDHSNGLYERYLSMSNDVYYGATAAKVLKDAKAGMYGYGDAENVDAKSDDSEDEDSTNLEGAEGAEASLLRAGAETEDEDSEN